MRLEALLVDVDGTLIDSNELHTDCWVEAFAHFDRSVDRAEIRAQIGKGGDLLVPDTLSAKDTRRFGEELKTYRGELWKRRYIDTVRPLPGAVETLQELHRRGIRLVLASSSNPDEVEHYVRMLGIAELLDGATSKEDAEMSKPSPEIFQEALARAASDPARTAVIGDTPWDILAAHRIPLPVIAVLTGGFSPASLGKAEFLCEDLPAMAKELDRIDDYFRD